MIVPGFRAQILSLLTGSPNHSSYCVGHFCYTFAAPENSRSQPFSRPPLSVEERKDPVLSAGNVAQSPGGREGDTLVVVKETISHEGVPFKEGEQVSHACVGKGMGRRRGAGSHGGMRLQL